MATSLPSLAGTMGVAATDYDVVRDQGRAQKGRHRGHFVPPRRQAQAFLAALPQEIAQRTLVSPTAGNHGQVADDQSGRMYRRRLHVFGIRAGVPDMGIRQGYDLPAVGGIGEDLLVAGHRGIEDDFTDGLAVSTNGSALENGAILQSQYSRRIQMQTSVRYLTGNAKPDRPVISEPQMYKSGRTMPPAHGFADRSAIRRSLLNAGTVRQSSRALFFNSARVLTKQHIVHVIESRLLLPGHLRELPVLIVEDNRLTLNTPRERDGEGVDWYRVVWERIP